MFWLFIGTPFIIGLIIGFAQEIQSYNAEKEAQAAIYREALERRQAEQNKLEAEEAYLLSLKNQTLELSKVVNSDLDSITDNKKREQLIKKNIALDRQLWQIEQKLNKVYEKLY